ncbi:MAG: tetratricopeptide repeat protein, partial [Polyangia bacterium]
MRPLTLLLAGLLLAVAACNGSEEAPVAGPVAAGTSASAAARPARLPATPAELPTSDAAIALGNVDAQILGYEQARKRMPQSNYWPLRLAALYDGRGQALGRIVDYETALARADEAVRLVPNDGDALLARASARARLHRFAEASADLDAAAHGASPERVDGARAAIWSATGQEREALAIRARLATARPELGTLAAEAMSLAALGRVSEAERRFVEAQARFRDVTPLPIAALYFQAGLVEERAGRPSSARELYEAARARLPEHAQATAHLATLLAASGRRAQAVALLRPLVAVSDDPEYAGTLAGLVGGDEAARLRAQAGKRYDALIARHPEAFADHAARFWLAAGAQPRKALPLAERNLLLRPTADAYELAIAAMLANDHAARACALADRALALPTASPSLQL